MFLLRNSVNTILRAKVIHSLRSVEHTRTVKRWVAPTLRELRRRSKLLGPQEPQPRSGYAEWNYRSELYAFGKRLNEEFQLPLLQTAFTQRSYILQEQHRQRELGIEEADVAMADNEQLAERGSHLANEYVNGYLRYSLPDLLDEGRQAFNQSLLSEESLAHIALHLGIKELIFDAEYPPSQAAMAKSLLAVIGALAESSGEPRAFLFIRDFICTQLNQKDPMDLWRIEDPEEVLRRLCKERNLAEPEPRLLGDCGRNTLLATYHVGVYANKQMIGKGFGEDVPTAITTASLDAIQRLCGIQDSMRPFNFKVQVEPNAKPSPRINGIQ